MKLGNISVSTERQRGYVNNPNGGDAYLFSPCRRSAVRIAFRGLTLAVLYSPRIECNDPNRAFNPGQGDIFLTTMPKIDRDNPWPR